MGSRSVLLAFLVPILVLSVFFAGCSDNGSTDSVTTVPTTSDAAKFGTGDIIAKTASSTESLMLIVKYNAATDEYERALVYKKSDGTYYRKDSNTDLVSRATAERLYPAKVTHVSSLTAVPVGTPTTTTVAPTTTVTTTTTTSYPAPTVSSITPATGAAGTTVSITSIYGTNFRTGASVKLSNVTTSTTISGKTVSVESASNITCKFTIPSTAIAGRWTVTVTNPDGKAGKLAEGFEITNESSTVTPAISSVTPASAYTGQTVDITNLAGTNLLDVTSVKLQKSGKSDISATNVIVVSSSKVTCTIDLDSVTAGKWDITVINEDGESDTVSDIFTVKPVAAFSASNISGSAPLIVAFTDLSYGSPTIWSWSFGDGGTSTTENPVHTYTAAGIYSVSLTASASGSVSNQTSTPTTITVSS
jgi:glycine cleavage system H lipoate-binding protein